MVLCIVSTTFTNATNLCNVFLIFYDYLIFWEFNLFGAFTFAVANLTISTFYFKTVIYLRGIMDSIEERSQIRLTLISSHSDRKNMIVVFVFNFIPLFLLLPHKIDLRLTAGISAIFLLFRISHFCSKIHWAHFLRIP